MNTTDFTADDIFSAYKKLKHYFYYDNTSLFIRRKIAEFEKSIEACGAGDSFNDKLWAKMDSIANAINSHNSEYWLAYFKDHISYCITPKTFHKQPSSLLSNRTEETNLQLQRINVYIDASIEVHIIAVLWLKHAGKLLAPTIDKDNYAYKLELTNEEDGGNLVGGLRIYKPYFLQYQNWRDNAIEKAEQLLKEKKDLVILSLDIKEYFYSIKLNLEEIKDEVYKKIKNDQLNDKVEKLFFLLEQIHGIYNEKIASIKQIPILSKQESILPIGLLSSGLLGNLYLRKFDSDLKETLNPAYYGRYVDDILMVLTNVSVNHNAVSPVNVFLSKYFVDRKLLDYDNIEELSSNFRTGDAVSGEVTVSKYAESNLKKDDYIINLAEAEKLRFHLTSFPNLVVQSSKVVLQNFDHKESPAIINKFKKNIEKNRSEFRYLPDEDKVDTEFDEEAFSLHYNDSVNKLRSIKEFSEDKYGASKYLAGKIFATSMSDEAPDENTTKQILTFFKGIIGLSFHSLWEKVATYFIINNQYWALAKFYSQSRFAINNIKTDTYSENTHSDEVNSRIKNNLEIYLDIAIATPLAFNPRFASKWKTDMSLKDKYLELTELAYTIRTANMFRHSWVGLPGINYTRYLLANEKNNNLLKITDEDLKANGYLADSNRLGETHVSSLEIDDRLQLLSPRYVHFHEINLLEIFKCIHSTQSIDSETIKMFDEILDSAFEKYWHINYDWKHHRVAIDDRRDLITALKKSYFEINSDEENSAIITVKNEEDEIKVNKKIALANIKLEKANIENSYLGKSNTSKERRQQLFKLINLVEKERCDLFVLPEVSIPYQWISLLAYQSSRRNIGIIGGLEHWVNKHRFAFNFMVTCLPIKKKNYSTCLIKIRLKNHYSHEEKRQLKGYRLLIPREAVPSHPKRYDLFHWKKCYFSVYNCFELADIQDRSIFKSKVDFIVASEYNKDVNYFSEIAGSWVRDVHCYFIQVNSSDYGDSRVVQPSSTVRKNVLQIKGGSNSTIVVGELKIKELRGYQYKEYELQKDDENFKPTPPDFNRDNVLKRIKDI